MTSQLLLGNSLEVLRTLPEASAHCCVTSPPYWSLRDYGVPPTVWPGRNGPTCRHNWTDDPFCLAGCGAWRGCLGLEPTPELYVEHILAVFAEVRRVLRDDGTLWLNLGDCYAAGGRGGDTGSASGLEGSKRHQEESRRAGQRIGSRSSFRRDRAARGDVAHKEAPGVKPKDLVGIPWMVAFALRAQGWYLRSDVIWHKPNPMPESISDRPTKAHEYLFLLAKSDDYFYDAHPIREGVTGNAHARGSGLGRKAAATARGRVRQNASFSASVTGVVGGRNRRSVWTIPTAPYPGAHFATYPPRLVEPCILAGTSEHGCCSVCGAPFTRIVEKGEELLEQKVVGGCNRDGQYHGKATKAYDGTGAQDPSAVKARILAGMRERITVGWKPGCRHTLREIEPCVVLDPFAGSGTTGMVAGKLGRSFVGIDLNPSYIAMANQRAGIRPAVEATA